MARIARDINPNVLVIPGPDYFGGGLPNYGVTQSLTDFTYSMWIYINSNFLNPGGYKYIMSKPDVTGITDVYRISIGHHVVGFGIYSWELLAKTHVQQIIISDIDAIKEKWLQLIFMYDSVAGEIRFYVNGELQSGIDSLIPDPGVDSYGLLLTNAGLLNSGYPGRIAEFGLWNRALSDEEVYNLSNEKYTPRLIEDGLLIAVRMLGFQDPEPDTSGYDLDCDITPDYPYIPFNGPVEHVPDIATIVPGSDVVGIYQNEVKGIWEFNQSLEDKISINDFISTDKSNYQRYTKFDLIQGKLVGKYGLKFEEDKKWTAGDSISFTNVDSQYGMTMGFLWYSPEVVGFARHAVSRKLTNRITPIVAKANSTISGGFEYITSGEWIVSEFGYSNTQNAIQLALCSSGGYPTSVYVSRPYNPGWHNVFITYIGKGTVCLVKIEIDGKSENFYTSIRDATVSTTSSEIRLNDIGFGYTAHKKCNNGAVIGDLVIRSGLNTDVNDAIKMMRFGWEYIAKSEFYYKKFLCFGVGYHQESTVNTTSIFPDGDNLTVARSDGSILRGERPIWDINYTFNNLDNIDMFEPQNKNNLSIINDTQLRIESTAIRIP